MSSPAPANLDCDFKFTIGQRVKWFKYSIDMVIMDGGAGVIIDRKFEEHGPRLQRESDWKSVYEHSCVYHVLRDGMGDILVYPEVDLDDEESEE